jgi:hypothetical protein
VAADFLQAERLRLDLDAEDVRVQPLELGTGNLPTEGRADLGDGGERSPTAIASSVRDRRRGH